MCHWIVWITTCFNRDFFHSIISFESFFSFRCELLRYILVLSKKMKMPWKKPAKKWTQFQNDKLTINTLSNFAFMCLIASRWFQIAIRETDLVVSIKIVFFFLSCKSLDRANIVWPLEYLFLLISIKNSFFISKFVSLLDANVAANSDSAKLYFYKIFGRKNVWFFFFWSKAIQSQN